MISFFAHDGVELCYRDGGAGDPVLFQHGLGGDEKQVADIFPDMPGYRRITLECRGQGRSGFGPPERLSIATFADDLAALAGKLALDAVIIGGISMGAAIVLRLAVRGNFKVRALVLARPAWVTRPAPLNMKPYALVGELMMRHPADEASRLFAESAVARELAQHAPDNLASLHGFFARPQAKQFGALLKTIAADGPGVTESELRAIDVPTLVIGHGRDLAHPLAYAEELADLIPHAQLRKITPKAESADAYRWDFKASLEEFLESIR
ncbi:alpha/beta fold hydrolase [Taklimakanibacter lacteus]|uniref:alpha/beta fold hydrolase n=1 Tax=Taklimakanibacter lacteus TaxID=2268456 RepID=UPI0034D72F26